MNSAVMELQITDAGENTLVVTDDMSQYYLSTVNPVRHAQPLQASHHNTMGMTGHLGLPQTSQNHHLNQPLQHGMGSMACMRQVHTIPGNMDIGDGLQMLGNVCSQTQQENIGVPRAVSGTGTIIPSSFPVQNYSCNQIPMTGSPMQHPPPSMVISTQAKDHVYSRNFLQRDNINYQSTNEAHEAALNIMAPNALQDNIPRYQTLHIGGNGNIAMDVNSVSTTCTSGMSNVISHINSFSNSLTFDTVSTVNTSSSMPQPAVVTQTIDSCQLSELRGQYATVVEAYSKDLEAEKTGKRKQRLAAVRDTNDSHVPGNNQVTVEQVVVHVVKQRKKGTGRKAKVKNCHFCNKELVEPDKSVLFKIGEDGKSVFFDTCNSCLAIENAKIGPRRIEPFVSPSVPPVSVVEVQVAPVYTPKPKPEENVCQVCSKPVEKILSVIASIENGKVSYLNACKECSQKPKQGAAKEDREKKKLKLRKKKKIRKLKQMNVGDEQKEETVAPDESVAPQDAAVGAAEDVGTDADTVAPVTTEPCEVIVSGSKVSKTVGTQVDENPYKWKCITCKKLFSSKNELQKHRRQNHRYYRLFQCDQCSTKIKIYSTTELVSCPCGKVFDQTNYSPYTLAKQFYVKRTLGLKCPICEKTFSSRRGLVEHQKIHSDLKPYVCTVCGKKFRTHPPLRIHMRVHTGEKPYKCEMCGKCFRQSSALSMHIRHHTGETPYSCEVCSKKFARRSQYTKHMESHTEKTHECIICNKKFPTEVRLKRHHRKHTDQNPYRCQLCGMNYEENSAYRRHMQKHDDMNPYRCSLCRKQFGGKRGLLEHATVHQEGNEFKCGICGVEFLTKNDLDGHIQSHFVEKPYKCQQCDLSFSTKSLLENHTNFHASSREFFDCKKCHKKFTKRVTLDMHMRRHDGDKPFKCFICGEQYLWSTTLDSHMKTHYIDV